jgi:hypothetical protein
VGAAVTYLFERHLQLLVFMSTSDLTHDAVGDFVDAGSAYSFDVGTAGAGAVAATLTVIPPPDRRTALRATLVCDGREVSQSESLGSAEADRIAAAEGGLPISGIGSTAAGRPEGHPGSFVKHGSFRIKS